MDEFSLLVHQFFPNCRYGDDWIEICGVRVENIKNREDYLRALLKEIIVEGKHSECYKENSLLLRALSTDNNSTLSDFYYQSLTVPREKRTITHCYPPKELIMEFVERYGKDSTTSDYIRQLYSNETEAYSEEQLKERERLEKELLQHLRAKARRKQLSSQKEKLVRIPNTV